MRVRRRGLLLLAALVVAPLAGCLGPAQGGPVGAIAFETIDAGQDSGIEAEQMTVVRNQTAWQELWQEHAPEDDRPTIDFEETMVAAIFKGESPDGCHGAEIENVSGDGDEIEVQGAFFEVTDAYCTQQITYPFHIVAFERHDEAVTFDVREETRQQGTDDSQGGNETGGSGEASYTCRDPGTQANELTSSEQVAFETVDEGQQSQLREACVTVAANETAWRDLWRDHHGASTADDQRPEVDLEENIVVAIFKGESPDACHGAEIEEATRDGDDVVVHGVFYEEQDDACAEVVTAPFHIAEIPRPQGEVVFDVREETR